MGRALAFTAAVIVFGLTFLIAITSILRITSY